MGDDRQSNRGQSLVELALLLPFLLWVCMGIVDFGRVYYYDNIAINATRSGARVGADSSKTQAQIRAAVIADANGRIQLVNNATYIPITETVPAGSTPPYRKIDTEVTVGVNTSVTLITPLIGRLVGNPVQIRRSATMKVIY